MNKANPGIELSVPRQALLETGHADQHDRHSTLIEDVSNLFEARGAQPVGLVENDEFRWAEPVAVNRRGPIERRGGPRRRFPQPVLGRLHPLQLGFERRVLGSGVVPVYATDRLLGDISKPCDRPL